MMAINLIQAKQIDRSTLKFKYISPDELTDIIREATYNDDIVIGNPKVITSKEFLNYPVAWSKKMEKMTGLYIEQDILPAYLSLVMHANTTLFRR